MGWGWRDLLWTSREAAELVYARVAPPGQATFGAEPIVTYYETYVTVDNVAGETVVREGK